MSRDPFSDPTGPSFSQSGFHRQPAITSPPSSNPWLKILGVAGVAAVVFCGGLLAVGVVALQSAITPATSIELPPRPAQMAEAFAADAADFNAALQRGSDQTLVPSDIQTFIEEAFQSGLAEQAIPFDQGQFIAAVGNSPDIGPPLTFIDRITISTWLDEYVPTPNKFDDYYQIFAADVSPDGLSAKVFLTVYSSDNQADSQVWFLVKDQASWKVYDWQCLEYGRRMSDEYAAFLRGPESTSPGYDDAMTLLGDAMDLYYGGDSEAAVVTLREAEATPMLKEDRDVARLRIAYTYMSIQRYDLAIPPLKRIRSPDQMWGVYPVLSTCYLNTDQPDQALAMAKRADSQTPNHPRTHWLMGTILDDLGRTDEAADRMALALDGCPRDHSIVSAVIANRRAGDIEPLMRSANANGVTGWVDLAASATIDEAWAATLVEAFERLDGTFHFPDGLMGMLRGNQAWASGDYDAAATHFLAAWEASQDPVIREFAIADHVNSRIQNDRYTELFDETADPLATFKTIARWVFEGDFYGSPEKLLEAVDQRLQKPPAEDVAAEDVAVTNRWLEGIAGWCRHQKGDEVEAAAMLTKFVVWRTAAADDDGSAIDADDNYWMDDGARSALAEAMLNADQTEKLLALLPDDLLVQSLVTARLRSQGVRACSRTINSLPSSNQPVMQLLRTRLQAAVESISGNGITADQWHAKAAAMGIGLDPERDADLARTLIIDRARDLVWNRVRPGDIVLPSDRDDAETLVIDVIADAVVLQDDEMIRVWSDQAAHMKMDDEATLRVAQETYKALVTKGRYSEAADLFPPSDSDPSDAVLSNRPYDRTSDYRQRALLRAGRFDEVIAEAKRLPSGSAKGKPISLDDAPVDSATALVALLNGDSESLDAVLWKRNSDDVAEWFSYTVPDEFIAKHVGDPAMQSILNRYPFSVGYQTSRASGQLLLQAGTEVNQVTLQKSFGEEIEIVRVASQIDVEDAAGWLVKVNSGHRYLVSVQPQTLKAVGWPDQMLARSTAPVQRLAIAVVDHLPDAERRLFRTAESLARILQQQSIAFCWTDRQLTWVATEDSPLTTQLAWKDRVPATHETLRRPLAFTDESVTPMVDYRDAVAWTNDLKKAGGPIDVQVTIQFGDTKERIGCKLLDVDADGYGLLVEPQTDSVLNPIVIAGIPCKVGLVNVRKMN